MNNNYLTVKIGLFVNYFIFAIVKGALLATIGLITSTKKEHASLLSFLESFFMVGIVFSAFLFSYFVVEEKSNSWLNAYYFIGAAGIVAIILLSVSSLDERQIEGFEIDNKTIVEQVRSMFYLVAKPLVVVFVLSAFLYVLLEQGITSWLPSFNNQGLNLSSKLSIQMGAILALSIALGRLFAGFFLRKFDWFYFVLVCLLASLVLVIGVMPLVKEFEGPTITSFFDAPAAAL
jgi:fucose permease